jgi:hypothetical protein
MAVFNLGSELLQLEDTLAVDSRLLVGSEKKIQIRRGSSNFTVNRQTASSLSNNQIIWNVVLNSPQSTVIDPYMYAEVFASATITATGGTATVQQYLTDLFSLRQYPLASVTATSTVTINNQQVSCNPNQFIHALSWNQPAYTDQAMVQSLTPIYPDKMQVYSDAAGSNISPLLGYYSGGEHYSDSRGIFNSDFTTVTGTTGTWQFNFVIREPIINPLLDYNPQKQREALAFVNNFNVQLQFTSNLARIFSFDAVNAPNITSIAVNITSANLVMNWLTVPVSQILPPIALRSFVTLVSQSTVGISVSPGQQVTLSSQSYSFNQIPKKLWVFVCDSQYDIAGVAAPGKTDTFFSIQNLNILFNNRQSLLGNMTASDLYNNCQADSGSRMSFMEAQHFVGSVLELDPVKLFGLQDDQSSGLIGQFNFSAQIMCTNISSNTITPNVWIVQGYDSILQTDQASISNLIQGFITQEAVIRANSLPAKPTLYVEHDIYGGGFLDTLKNIFNKVKDFAKENKLISKGLKLLPPNPYTTTASKVAEELGYGGRYTPRRQIERRYESLVH